MSREFKTRNEKNKNKRIARCLLNEFIKHSVLLENRIYHRCNVGFINSPDNSIFSRMLLIKK